MRTILSAALILLLAGCATAPATRSAAAAATTCSADASWDDPAAPRHLFGNTWYVGTCGVSAILVTSRRGHILLDGTTAESAQRVADNIRSLGFSLGDVRFILTSHAHRDHAGGIAELQRLTGAVAIARDADALSLQRGRGDRADPQFESAGRFPAVAVVRPVDSSELIRLGKLAIRSHAAAGHTPGGSSWTWRSCEGRRCLDMVYADSLTAISDDNYRYSDDIAHPGYLARFRRSIETVRALPCDILLTPHPGSNQLWQRLAAGGRGQLIDPGACRRYAEFARQALDARIAQETAQSR